MSSYVVLAWIDDGPRSAVWEGNVPKDRVSEVVKKAVAYGKRVHGDFFMVYVFPDTEPNPNNRARERLVASWREFIRLQESPLRA